MSNTDPVKENLHRGHPRFGKLIRGGPVYFRAGTQPSITMGHRSRVMPTTKHGAGFIVEGGKILRVLAYADVEH